MAKKTNTSKTAHVMNLLSKNQEAAPVAPTAPDEASPSEARTQETAPASTPAAPPSILPSLNLDLEISTQIKSALEDSLDDGPSNPAAETQKSPESAQSQEASEPSQAPPELEQAANGTAVELQADLEIQESVLESTTQSSESGNESETIPAEPPVQAEEDVSASEISTPTQELPAADAVSAALDQQLIKEAAAAESQAETEPQEPTLEPSSQPSAEKGGEAIPTGAPVQAADSRIVFTNIMQTLVEKKVDRYIQMFGLCSCPKCVADVKAIALNNLVPKYIVTVPEEESPWVTIYEGRFTAEVTAQILHACKIVMENPLHDL